MLVLINHRSLVVILCNNWNLVTSFCNWFSISPSNDIFTLLLYKTIIGVALCRKITFKISETQKTWVPILYECSQTNSRKLLYRKRQVKYLKKINFVGYFKVRWHAGDRGYTCIYIRRSDKTINRRWSAQALNTEGVRQVPVHRNPQHFHGHCNFMCLYVLPILIKWIHRDSFYCYGDLHYKNDGRSRWIEQ